MKSKQSIKEESCISLKGKNPYMAACTFIRDLNTRIMNCKPHFSSSDVLRRCCDPLPLPPLKKSQVGQILPSVIAA